MEEIKQKIKWIVANHTSVAEADPLNTELEDELFALFSQALQKQREEIIKLIKTPMSTEFEDPEEESADYSIEDFRARLLSNLTTK